MNMNTGFALLIWTICTFVAGGVVATSGLLEFTPTVTVSEAPPLENVVSDVRWKRTDTDTYTLSEAFTVQEITPENFAKTMEFQETLQSGAVAYAALDLYGDVDKVCETLVTMNVWEAALDSINLRTFTKRVTDLVEEIPASDGCNFEMQGVFTRARDVIPGEIGLR